MQPLLTGRHLNYLWFTPPTQLPPSGSCFTFVELFQLCRVFVPECH